MASISDRFVDFYIMVRIGLLMNYALGLGIVLGWSSRFNNKEKWLSSQVQ